MLPSILSSRSTCFRCNAELTDASCCPACGADRDVELRAEIAEQTDLATARRWILVIGVWYVASCALVLLLGAPMIGASERGPLVAVSAALFVAHLGLWSWAKREAWPAAVAALMLFVAVIVATTVADPANAYRGIILKILGLAALGRAVVAGYAIRRLRLTRRATS